VESPRNSLSQMFGRGVRLNCESRARSILFPYRFSP
jgi:hypothetical protein